MHSDSVLCLHVSVGRVSVRVSVRVCMCSRAGLRNRILRSECLRCCCCCWCCLLSVARRLLVVGSFLFSLNSVFGKGARDFVNFELCFLWICLFAGSRSCGSWSSQQHPSREARIETATEIMQWDRDLGLGSDRRSAALFVLASWRVLCVCCNQITNDHKKYSSSSSSALRL